MTSVAATVFAEVAAPQQLAGGARPEPGLFGATLQQAQVGLVTGQAPAEAAVQGDDAPALADTLTNLLVFSPRPGSVVPDRPDPPASQALVLETPAEEQDAVTVAVGVVLFPQQATPQRLPAQQVDPVGLGEPAGLPGAPAVIEGPWGDSGREPGRLPAEPAPMEPVLDVPREPARLPAMPIQDPVGEEQTTMDAPPQSVMALGLPHTGKREPGTPGSLPLDPVDAAAEVPARLPVTQLRDILQVPDASDQALQPGGVPAQVMTEAVGNLPLDTDRRGDEPIDGLGTSTVSWTPTRPADTATPVPTEPARLPAEPVNHARLAGEVHSMVLTGETEARLNLEPADLGQVVVRLLLEDGRVAIDMRAVQADAREALENALPGLQSALEQQGLRVEGISVSAETAGWPSGSSGQGAFEQWQGQQQRAPWVPPGQRLGGYGQPDQEAATAGRQGPSAGTTTTGGIDYRA